MFHCFHKQPCLQMNFKRNWYIFNTKENKIKTMETMSQSFFWILKILYPLQTGRMRSLPLQAVSQAGVNVEKWGVENGSRVYFSCMPDLRFYFHSSVSPKIPRI